MIRLSGGQKQRVSMLERFKVPIILLDEATSSLDTDTEEIVQNAIINLTKTKQLSLLPMTINYTQS